MTGFECLNDTTQCPSFSFKHKSTFSGKNVKLRRIKRPPPHEYNRRESRMTRTLPRGSGPSTPFVQFNIPKLSCLRFLLTELVMRPSWAHSKVAIACAQNGCKSAAYVRIQTALWPAAQVARRCGAYAACLSLETAQTPLVCIQVGDRGSTH